MFGALFAIPSLSASLDWRELARAFAPPSICAPHGGSRPSRAGAPSSMATEALDAAWRDGASYFSALQSRRRAMIDAALYDLGRLDARDRQALAPAGPRAVIVAHPQGRRPLRVYPSVEAWSMSLDADARILSLVGPGSGVEAAAAFARQIADARGEPTLTTAPSREPFDLLRDFAAPMTQAAGRAADHARPIDPRGVDTLLALLERASDLSLIVSHGLGGLTLSALLRAECEAAQRRRQAIAPSGLRVATLGGAPALPSRFDAVHGIGALDWFGWSISDPSEPIGMITPFCGATVNPRVPGALPLERMLATMIGEAAPAQRRRGLTG